MWEGEVSGHEGRMICELQSLNRRYLDLQINLPKKLSMHEVELRRYLTQIVGRGQITCTLSWQAHDMDQISLEPNTVLVQHLQDAWCKLAALTQHSTQMPVEFLMHYQDRMFVSKETSQEQIAAYVMQACQEACSKLQAMKQQEGTVLAQNLASYLEQLKQILQQIEQRAPDMTQIYRNKLLERLQPILSSTVLEQDERVLKEVALFAEKVDVSEEIVRAKSHLDHFMQWLCTPFSEEKHAKGKTAEFILQELQREVNTLGSKANDLAISKKVIEMKSLLEKMREQIQNVE